LAASCAITMSRPSDRLARLSAGGVTVSSSVQTCASGKTGALRSTTTPLVFATCSPVATKQFPLLLPQPIFEFKRVFLHQPRRCPQQQCRQLCHRQAYPRDPPSTFQRQKYLSQHLQKLQSPKRLPQLRQKLRSRQRLSQPQHKSRPQSRPQFRLSRQRIQQ
jgi:hypothetical protein